MNQNIYKIFFTSLCALCFFSLVAQERYLEEVFTSFNVTPDVIYGQNISILTGAPAAQELKCDIYAPAEDTETERPLIVVAHTGSFLPPLFNGGVTGAKSDSVVTETCRRLVRRGFVVAAITYRQGWLPESESQNVRTGTLLQAAYRGIQDIRTSVRFFRKNAAEEGNQYGIDPSKIVLWGIGTGGYLSMGGATLDRYEEITLDKFIDSETLLPFVDTTLLGNFDATVQKPLCLPNHLGYSNDVQFAVNMGGALGDTTWLEGAPVPPVIGFHVLKDPFAPFYDGAVIVPTTMQFVVNVSGTRRIVEKANELGFNDVLNNIPGEVDPIQQIVNIFKTVDITLPGNVTIKLGEDHMYPFVTPSFEAGPWDWWGKPQLDAVVAGTNAVLGTDFNSDSLHIRSQIVNPGMSKEKGTGYIDTVFWYSMPRVCAALDLGCGFTSAVTTLNPADVGFAFGPNPTNDRIELKSGFEFPIEDVSMYDLQGRLVLKHIKVNTERFGFQVDHLTPGMYLMKTKFEQGIITEKVMIH